MKQKELEDRIIALEKEIAELKMRPYIQHLPCYQQHYPNYPQPYYPQWPTWSGNQLGMGNEGGC